jgi:hypothetical protein
MRHGSVPVPGTRLARRQIPNLPYPGFGQPLLIRRPGMPKDRGQPLARIHRRCPLDWLLKSIGQAHHSHLKGNPRCSQVKLGHYQQGSRTVSAALAALRPQLACCALNPRVRGSSPWRRTRFELGFYRPRLFFMCPFCPHVCSVFARAHGPCNPGLVKNGLSGVGAAPDRLDQWSRSSARVPERARSPLYRWCHAQ